MTWIAFFRNLNQGQRGNPSTADIVDAFTDAGATGVVPVRGNGTVLFEADDVEAAVSHVRRRLEPWSDAVFVRSVSWVQDLLATAGEDPARTEVTLFDRDVTLPVALPHSGLRCRIVTSGAGFAVVVNDVDGQSNDTPTVERLIGSPATSRNVSTLALAIARTTRG